MNLRQALLVGLVLGVVAGAVVWYLERFESDRMMGEIKSYLEKIDAFRAWEAEHGPA